MNYKLIIIVVLLAFLVYPVNAWESNVSVASGLGDVGSYWGFSQLETFYMDDTWYLMTGEYDGDFHGFNWTGTTWQSDPSIVVGLPVISHNTPEIFYKDSTWYLISGSSNGNFHGFNWTGSTWQSDSSIISGLIISDGGSTPDVFYKDDTWYLITGDQYGDFFGFYWNVSTWQSDTAIIYGLVDVVENSAPTVFYMDDGNWYLISGMNSGGFDGYKWIDPIWVPDTWIEIGLTNVGERSKPETFNINNTWCLLSGERDGTFNGYDLLPYPVSGIVTDPTDSPVVGAEVTIVGIGSNITNETGYYYIPGARVNTYPVTATATGYTVYGSSVSIISDTIKNIVMTFQSEDSFGFDVNILSSQNTVLREMNTSFGDMLAGNTLILSPSFNLTNYGNEVASVEATFTTSYNSMYGFANTSGGIGGSNFSLQQSTWDTLDNLNTGTVLTDNVLGDGYTYNWDTRLTVPAGQPALRYIGRIELTFS